MITVKELKKKYDDMTLQELKPYLFEFNIAWEKEYTEMINEHNNTGSSNLEFYKGIEESETRMETEYLISLYNYKETDYTLSPIVNGTQIRLDRFKYLCETGKVLDSMGIGYYATKTEVSSIPVYPSDYIEKKLLRTDFPYIVWNGNILNA